MILKKVSSATKSARRSPRLLVKQQVDPNANLLIFICYNRFAQNLRVFHANDILWSLQAWLSPSPSLPRAWVEGRCYETFQQIYSHFSI
jgi:hypothetical protein